MVRGFQALGWSRASIIHVNDAWGRGLAQDLLSAASGVGAEIEKTVRFSAGVTSEIEEAINTIEQTGSRIIVCVAFKSDFAVLADVANVYGMLTAGYVWIVPSDAVVNDAVAMSPDPERTSKLLTGWFTVSIDPILEKSRSCFQEVLEREPLGHLNYSGLEVLLSPEVIHGGLCDQPCALIYDAVWSAAIALGRVG
eukprot:1558633-Rhodomonas_salina.1